MRAVVQRVSRSSVVVEGQTVGEIGAGVMILLGLTLMVILLPDPLHLQILPMGRVGTAHGYGYIPTLWLQVILPNLCKSTLLQAYQQDFM